jgi:YNFM family putative membrane transporter
LFLAGFCTFAQLYAVQPLLPIFATEFGVSPTASSLALSATTASLAVALLFAGAISDAFGRKRVMAAALWLSALLSLAVAAIPQWQGLLLARALTGVALSGVPAVAMAYLSEEVEPRGLGASMGLYIAGNGLGGLCGRLMVAALADWTSWRTAMLVLGAVGLLAAFEFWRSLPASRHFQPSRLSWSSFLAGLRLHFSDAGLPWMFAIGFLMMGCFVSLYNYLGYRLAAPPFDLRPSLLGAVFSLYLVGMAGSAIVGRLADRFGRRWPTVGGMALLALGLLPLALGGAESVGLLLGGLALAGAGLGLGSAGLQISAVEAAARSE